MRSTGGRLNWALSKAAVEPRLPPELLDRIIELMRLRRGAFAALDRRFPIPSAADVRQAAVNLEVLARNESLRPKRLAEVLGMFATLEQDVGQEIGAAYPPVVDKPEFKRYQDAVTALAAALYARENDQVLLNRQDDIVTAARDLAEVVFEAPEADAGQDKPSRPYRPGRCHTRCRPLPGPRRPEDRALPLGQGGVTMPSPSSVGYR